MMLKEQDFYGQRSTSPEQHGLERPRCRRGGRHLEENDWLGVQKRDETAESGLEMMVSEQGICNQVELSKHWGWG